MHESTPLGKNKPISERIAGGPGLDGRQTVAASIDPKVLQSCVHCGLCTAACPTYTELGNENDGPRGRIYLMRLVHEGQLPLDERVRQHWQLCLDCRACETACPSGVRYGRLIEPVHLALDELERRERPLARWDWFREVVLFRIFPYRDRIRLAIWPVRLLQKLGVYDFLERLGLWRLVPGRLGQMLTLVPPPTPQGPRLPRFLPAVGRRRARVAFFVGCVAEAMFRDVHWATLRVLQQNGCDILIPPGQGCCGAIHYHNGDREGARRLADANVAAFDLDEIDAIVVNHAGCGAMLKEYGLHWQDTKQQARRRFAAKVQDVNEFLDKLGLTLPTGRIEAVAVYHDACHLAHAQKIVEAPRRLLRKIPGLVLKQLPESEICCGSAGVYNLNHPDLAGRLGDRKLQNILSTGAQIVLASNAGCLLQIQREVRQHRAPLQVMHPMTLLDLSYREEPLPREI